MAALQRLARLKVRGWHIPLRLIPSLAAAVATVTALVACSGGSSSGDNLTSGPFPAPGSIVDKCSLVTPAELTQIVGGQPFASGVPSRYICNFTNGADRVSVYAADWLTEERTLQEFRNIAITEPTDVSSLGEAAFWQPESSELSVRKGTIVLRVQVYTAEGGEANPKAAVSIARLALGRLSTPAPSPSAS